MHCNLLTAVIFSLIMMISLVAHSMGYAYSLGMIQSLKKCSAISLGNFYVIAPENACSGTVDLSQFENVWQYGSDERNAPLWQQDGIAPQCPIQNLPTTHRIFIPKSDLSNSFLDAHYIKSYGWIFKNITQPNQLGYVKKR